MMLWPPSLWNASEVVVDVTMIQQWSAEVNQKSRRI